MPRHKQMIGTSYHIVSQSTSDVTVEYRYLCPYCKADTTVTSDDSADYLETLNRGGFYLPLTCSDCGKISDVRFWRSAMI